MFSRGGSFDMRWLTVVGCCLAVACGPAVTVVDAGTGGGSFFFGGGPGGGSSGGGFSTSGGTAGSSTSGGSAAGGSSAGGSAAGGSAGGTVSTGGGSSQSCGSGAFSATQLHASWVQGTAGGLRFPGGFDALTRRAFTMPVAVSPSLQSLLTLRLENEGTRLPDGGSRAFVESMPVSGALPTGSLLTAAFDEQSGVMTGVYRTPGGIDVVQLSVSDAGARFTTLQPLDAPDAAGFVAHDMYGTSSRLGVLSGNQLRPITITGGQARWETPIAGSAFTDLSTYDRAGDRVIGIGGYEFVNRQPQWVSKVSERSPTSGSWTTISMTGTGLVPMSSTIAPASFLVWDAADQRVLATSTRMATVGPGYVPTLLEANLVRREWRSLGDLNNSVTDFRPFFIDREKRQFFETSLTARSLAPGREFMPSAVSVTGTFPPTWFSTPLAAARAPDGTVLLLQSGSLRLPVFEPGTNRWAFARAVLPPGQSSGAIVVYDPVGSRFLVLFGITSAPVSAISNVNQPDFEPVVTTGQAPTAASSVVVSGSSLVTTSAGTVHALDLNTLVWRKLADVTTRRRPALFVHDGAVVITGGEQGPMPFVPTIERVDLSTGQVQVVTASGSPPTGYGVAVPLGPGLSYFDIGSSADHTGSRRFELQLSTPTSATWTSSDPNLPDTFFSGAIGVPGSSCNEAFVLGTSSLRLNR